MKLDSIDGHSYDLDRQGSETKCYRNHVWQNNTNYTTQ